MDNEKFTGEGLTYDDVLLLPAYSEVIPKDVQLKTRFTRNIQMNVPIVSAAMDTVTNSTMAIAMAQEGGIGILHKSMTIENQAKEARKVKRAENGMIIDPITVKKDARVKDILKIGEEHSFGGFPVVDDNNKLEGIVTNRDLRFERNPNRKVTEVMTSKNLVTTTEFTNFEKAADILQKHKIEKLPVVDKDFRLVGLITYKDIIKIKARPNASKDHRGRLLVAAAVGTGHGTEDRVAALVEAGVDAIVIDTAHGHSRGVIEMTRKIKGLHPDIELISGNIATEKAAMALIDAGADAVKVGIGPGSICTTRVIAGVGVPQLTAVFNIARAIQHTGVPVIADGGIRFSGDIVKAIAAGADSVMIGSLIAGVEEAPGETIIFEGRKYKTYRGMGSLEAMKDGSKDRYFQDAEDDIQKLVPEGIMGRVDYKGSLSEVIHQLIGGLRAGMGYCGAKDIKTLKKEARFIQITAAGVAESHPHGVTITREAPNYSRYKK